MEDLEPVLDRLGRIVLADGERCAAQIADAVDLRRVCDDVEARAAAAADTAAGHARFDDGVIDLDGDDSVKVDTGGFERLGLRDRARHAVKDEAVRAVVAGDPLADDADDDIVRNELASVHEAFGLQAGFGSVFDRFAKNVAGGNGGDVQLLADDLRLCALAGTGSTQKNQLHSIFLQLLQEAFVVTHEHLGLEALDRLKRNADHDDDGRAADREAAVLDHDTDDDRQDRNDRQIQSAEERDFVDNLQDEVGSRLARAEAGDEAAVLLEVIGDFDGVELDRRIEVAERNDQQEVADDVERALRVEDIGVHPGPEGAAAGAGEGNDRRGERRNGLREDDRQNAGHVDLDRQERALTTVHLAADHTLGVLDGDAALGVRDEHDEHNDQQHADDEQDRGVPLDRAGGQRGNERTDERRDAGHDACEQDHRNAVADAELIDLLAHPHQEGRAGHEGHDDDKTCKETGLVEQVVVLEHHIVGKAHQKSKADRGVAGDALDLLPAFFAALLGKTLQGGDGDGEKFNDNGCVDIRLDTDGEDRRLRERRTGHRVVQAQDRTRQLLREVGRQFTHVDVGNRNAGAQAVDHQNEQREEDLLAQLGDLPGITECCKHLHHLGLSARLFDFFLGRLREGCSLHGDLLGNAAVAKNLQTVLAIVQNAFFDQGRRVNDSAVFELIENRNIHSRQGLCEDVVEAALRDAACQRHLAAFEADAELAARTGLLALVSAACGLAVASAGTTALALIHMGRTHNRSKFM